MKVADFVNVALDNNKLFAATRGELFCLDPQSGEVRWHNPLKGFGLGLVSIAGLGMATSAWNTLATDKKRQEKDAASSDASASSFS